MAFASPEIRREQFLERPLPSSEESERAILGAILLDRDIPSKVLARSEKPILAAKDNDREGYVPNVVYTCGAMRVRDTLFMPYGISDSAIGFATAKIDDVLAALS